MKELGVGLIGSGFMGRAHALGYAAARLAFALPVGLRSEIIADATPELAESARAALGFARSTHDWRDVVSDPAVDIVDICAPNALHREIALAAIAHGKHVYCEKPLAPRHTEAVEMADAAQAAGVTTQLGFNYIMNPLFGLARAMIEAGELGEIYSYRGVHAEDYMSDPAAPYSFRNAPLGGGVAADLGSHAFATAEFLLGPIEALLGECRVVVRERTDRDGVRQRVETEDVAHAVLRFARGTTGTLEANWCATGRTMAHDFAVYGSKGSLAFSGERLNELHHFSVSGEKRLLGFTRIEAGPVHPPYGHFCPAPGHQLGFNDLKAIEIARFAEALAGAAPEPFNFRRGARIQGLVEALVMSSAAGGEWVRVDGL